MNKGWKWLAGQGPASLWAHLLLIRGCLFPCSPPSWTWLTSLYLPQRPPPHTALPTRGTFLVGTQVGDKGPSLPHCQLANRLACWLRVP